MDGDSKVILLADAMVLIDLGYLDAVWILPQMGPAEVLDVVLEECRHPRQPALADEIVASGITVIGCADIWRVKSEEYRTPEISSQDCMNLFYAKEFGRMLLTNEAPLRELCPQYHVKVHGTLWLIEQAFGLGLRTTAELCSWLDILRQRERRVPADEVRNLKRRMGC